MAGLWWRTWFTAALELVVGGFFDDDLSEGSAKDELQAEVNFGRDGIINPLFGGRSAPTLPRGTVALGTKTPMGITVEQNPSNIQLMGAGRRDIRSVRLCGRGRRNRRGGTAHQQYPLHELLASALPDRIPKQFPRFPTIVTAALEETVVNSAS